MITCTQKRESVRNGATFFTLLVCFLFTRETDSFLEGHMGRTIVREVGDTLPKASGDLLFQKTSSRLNDQESSAIFLSGSQLSLNSCDEGTEALNEKLAILCTRGEIEDAIKLLKTSIDSESSQSPNEDSFIQIISALTICNHPRAPETADELLQRMKSGKYRDCIPTAAVYHAVISAWAKSRRREAGQRCDMLLQELWTLYSETSDAKFVPRKASYISTIAALSHSRGGRKAAERAEKLLEDMETLRKDHMHLSPTTICVNPVLNAWCKSDSGHAARRCEAILKRMVELFKQGRVELQPNTTSFNTVLDSMARTQEKGFERRAEVLLERMEALTNEFDELKETCQPDEVSFNTVLNCWALSRAKGSARRASAILDHMERRFELNTTDLYPDSTAYTTVINAWARSKEKDSVQQAEQLLERCERAYQDGRSRAKPQRRTYNSLINCYSKSNDPASVEKAIGVLNQMKILSLQQGLEECKPDVVSYTSVIDCLCRQGTQEAAEMAETLFNELEDEFNRTGDQELKPNLLTYTATIKAIARSGVAPERAKAILDKMQALYKGGDKGVQPDVVSFNALLNAYGWSDTKGKSRKCFEIYKSMLEQYEKRRNVAVKPDIITCNTVLNACAFEKAETDSEKAQVMDIVVQVLEAFQTSAPRFGRPNHLTYALVLSSIEKHMPMSPRRLELAEATFWQCSQNGQVSILVVSQLHKTVTFEKFSELMGPALQSGEKETLRFDLKKLPDTWTKYALQALAKGGRRLSRPSRKRDVASFLSPPTKNASR